MASDHPREASHAGGRNSESDLRAAIDREEEAAETATARGSRTWWVLGIAAVLAMTAAVVYLYLPAPEDRLSWSHAGFAVQDDSLVEVRFDVTRDPDRAVTCRLEALDAGRLLIGSTEVEIEPGQDGTSRHLADLRTVARATTGYVEECWYTDGGAP